MNHLFVIALSFYYFLIASSSGSESITGIFPFEIKRYPTRIIVSLSTSPKRFYDIGPAIQSILSQSYPPDLVLLSIPHVFRRTNETYPPIDSVDILSHPKVKVHR